MAHSVVFLVKHTVICELFNNFILSIISVKQVKHTGLCEMLFPIIYYCVQHTFANFSFKNTETLCFGFSKAKIKKHNIFKGRILTCDLKHPLKKAGGFLYFTTFCSTCFQAFNGKGYHYQTKHTISIYLFMSQTRFIF